MDQRFHHKTIYTEHEKHESKNSLELIGTGTTFLDRISLAQACRSTINKWDHETDPFLHSKAQAYRMRPFFFSPTPHLIED